MHSYTYDLTNTLQYHMMDLKQMNSSENLEKNYGIKSKPCSKFFWNEFLLKDVRKKLSYPWFINLIHGEFFFKSIVGCIPYLK